MAGKNKGRQRIEITKMSKASNLLVTFSKRRSGLFKKASELSILCGAEIAIIVFSPAKKVFSFGHPTVETVVDRYLAATPSSAATPPNGLLQLVEAHRSLNVQELNMHLNDMLELVGEEKRRGEEMSQQKKAGHDGPWWEAPIKEMGLEELERLKEAMEDLRKNVSLEVEKRMIEEAAFYGPVAPEEAGGGDAGANVGGLRQVSVTPHGFAIGFGNTFF